jgi:hypothetical protein
MSGKLEWTLLIVGAVLLIVAAYYIGALDDMSIRGRS